MTKHNAKERPRSRAKTSSRYFGIVLVTAIILSIIAGYLFWPKIEPKLSQLRRAYLNTPEQAPPSPPPSAGIPPETKRPAQQVSDLPAAALESSSAEEPEGNQGASAEEPSGGTLQGTGNIDSAGNTPQALVKELNTFYEYLDRQPYMRDFALKEPSKVHFSRLLQKLMDNPPVVIRETDDILTLLKNTAHFYRILDKDNIVILKGILHRDRKSLEQILKTFYALTYHPEYLEKEYSLTLPPEALRDYAAFFLNTIGGRLYLFRRDSTSRMAISYYAIMVIDRANEEGNNPHGIDVRPALESLIEEIENSGKRLKFREEYLEHLYDLKEKYN